MTKLYIYWKGITHTYLHRYCRIDIAISQEQRKTAFYIYVL